MSADLIRQKARERHFLEQLLDGRKLENYKIPVPIKAELRKYQQVRVSFFFFFSVSMIPPQAAEEKCNMCSRTSKQLLERVSVLWLSRLFTLSHLSATFRNDVSLFLFKRYRLFKKKKKRLTTNGFCCWTKFKAVQRRWLIVACWQTSHLSV